jgi:hypothetical protein
VEATRSAKRVGLAVLPMLLLAGLAAQTSLGSVPAPRELRVLPREEALLVRWRVTSSEGLAGFRVRYRPVAAVTKPWSDAIRRPAGARSLTIAGLRVRRYEVMVRAVLSGGRAGGMATAIGKPLPRAEEEPPKEEPPKEEPPKEEPPPSSFVASIDTMKLSKDQAGSGFTPADAQAVDLAAKLHGTHITDDAPLEHQATMGQWAARIHADGKSVWYRLSALGGANMRHGDEGDGYPTYAPGYLTTLHNLMVAHPSFFKPGDILDGDAEAENSKWWAGHYGCGVQSPCTPCNPAGSNKPCAPVVQFNDFLLKMTNQENRDLAAAGIKGVDTTVHSTDPGTMQYQLEARTIKAMGKVTVDAYPDQSTTVPAGAAAAWLSALTSWHTNLVGKGLPVPIYVGEWGYSNRLNVSDAVQQAVIAAEVAVFPTAPFLTGVNYWVGPGAVGDGGYTQIMVKEGALWKLRPAANTIADFYRAETGR